MSRLIPAIDALTPQRTVIQLLRIMLLIDIAPAIIGAIFLSLRFDPNVGLPALLLAFPTSIVLIVLVLPGLERRFGQAG